MLVVRIEIMPLLPMPAVAVFDMFLLRLALRILDASVPDFRICEPAKSRQLAESQYD